MSEPERRRGVEIFQLTISGAAAIALFVFGSAILNEGINKHDSANIILGSFGLLTSVLWAEKFIQNIRTFRN